MDYKHAYLNLFNGITDLNGDIDRILRSDSDRAQIHERLCALQCQAENLCIDREDSNIIQLPVKVPEKKKN